MMIVGFDCGSTTVKANVFENGQVLWKDYRRHGTRVAEMALDFLTRMEEEIGMTPEGARVYITGSASGPIAPLIGAKQVQEVVAVAAAVERLHPEVMFVSEIGGEDMKTIFFTNALCGGGKSKQVMMQSACAGGTGNFIEKTARKLGVADGLPEMGYRGYTLHKVSPKCGIFAEADATTLVKAGVSVEEIIASLFDAVVYQNLSTLTKGNTP
ncbi:MAG: BadF/BadG/BcrA/BcrD ATPase family protein, partial [Candidatus Binatia bacterium]